MLFCWDTIDIDLVSVVVGKAATVIYRLDIHMRQNYVFMKFELIIKTLIASSKLTDNVIKKAILECVIARPPI